MTIIAYKDGVMAADSWAVTGSFKTLCPFPKILRLSDGGLVGAAGGITDIWTAFEWFRAGCPSEVPEFGKPDEMDMLWARPDGSLWRPGLGVSRWAPAYQPGAVGSAWQVAETALQMGHSAESAVQVCIDLRVDIGGPLQVERLHPE